MNLKKTIKNWMNPRTELIRMVKNLKNYQLKHFIISTIIAFKKKQQYSGETIFKGHDKEHILKTLQTDGIYSFGPVFSPEEIDAVIKKLENSLCFHAYKPALGTFKKEEAPPAVNTANYPVNEYASDDLFIKILYDPFLLDTIQSFLGCKPVFNDISLYWSLLNKDTARDAQIYHRDSNDMKFLALALYLTDVETENDGPFCYIKTSAKSTKFNKPKLRHTDEEIISAFGKENEVAVLGKRGTVVICDNFGFHKGKLPVDKERFVLFVHYGITNIKRNIPEFYDVVDPDKIAKLEKYKHLAGNIAFNLRKK